LQSTAKKRTFKHGETKPGYGGKTRNQNPGNTNERKLTSGILNERPRLNPGVRKAREGKGNKRKRGRPQEEAYHVSNPEERMEDAKTWELSK